jgi:hypothetical protein
MYLGCVVGCPPLQIVSTSYCRWTFHINLCKYMLHSRFFILEVFLFSIMVYSFSSLSLTFTGSALHVVSISVVFFIRFLKISLFRIRTQIHAFWWIPDPDTGTVLGIRTKNVIFYQHRRTSKLQRAAPQNIEMSSPFLRVSFLHGSGSIDPIESGRKVFPMFHIFYCFNK